MALEGYRQHSVTIAIPDSLGHSLNLAMPGRASPADIRGLSLEGRPHRSSDSLPPHWVCGRHRPATRFCLRRRRNLIPMMTVASRR